MYSTWQYFNWSHMLISYNTNTGLIMLYVKIYLMLGVVSSIIVMAYHGFLWILFDWRVEKWIQWSFLIIAAMILLTVFWPIYFVHKIRMWKGWE
jgi:hypothetical protein